MNTQELIASTIFIELDALLDTRLGVLTSMGEDVLKTVLETDYLHRFIDRFKGIDNIEFERLYKARNKNVLRYTIVTPMSKFLREFAEKTIAQIKSTPFHYKPKIILNVYPYELSPEEEVIMIATVRAITKELADIELVKMSYEEITPSYVKRNVAIMILYDYATWLETQSTNENFKKITCPEVGLLAPRIYFKMPEHPPNEDDDPFKAMETLASPLIKLHLMPIENFSMALVKQTT